MADRKTTDDEIPAEIDFSNGVRGKFASAFPKGSRVVVLDPDVAEVFKTQNSANAALRAVAEHVKQVDGNVEASMTAKEAIQEILNQATDNASYNEIMYNIYLSEKIDRGLKDVEAGNLVAEDEVEARLSRWDTK